MVRERSYINRLLEDGCRFFCRWMNRIPGIRRSWVICCFRKRVILGLDFLLLLLLLQLLLLAKRKVGERAMRGERGYEREERVRGREGSGRGTND